ncbi:hypothetical protein Hanom_Chr03g00200451 [Helianthus anomalus]
MDSKKGTRKPSSLKWKRESTISKPATTSPGANNDDDFETPLPVPFAEVSKKHPTPADTTHRDTADDDFVTQPSMTNQSGNFAHKIWNQISIFISL